MPRRWAVILGHKALFSTDDMDVVRRFTALGPFDIYDHSIAAHVSVMHTKNDAVDLIDEQEQHDFHLQAGKVRR